MFEEGNPIVQVNAVSVWEMMSVVGLTEFVQMCACRWFTSASIYQDTDFAMIPGFPHVLLMEQNHGTPTAKTESSTQDDLGAGIEVQLECSCLKYYDLHTLKCLQKQILLQEKVFVCLNL